MLCLIDSISSSVLEEYLGMQFLMIHLILLIDLQKQDLRFHLTRWFQCQLTQDHELVSSSALDCATATFVVSSPHWSTAGSGSILYALGIFTCNITQKIFRMANQDGWVTAHNIPKDVFWNHMQNLSPRLSWTLIQILLFIYGYFSLWHANTKMRKDFSR